MLLIMKLDLKGTQGIDLYYFLFPKSFYCSIIEKLKKL